MWHVHAYVTILYWYKKFPRNVVVMKREIRCGHLKDRQPYGLSLESLAQNEETANYIFDSIA